MSFNRTPTIQQCYYTRRRRYPHTLIMTAPPRGLIAKKKTRNGNRFRLIFIAPIIIMRPYRLETKNHTRVIWSMVVAGTHIIRLFSE